VVGVEALVQNFPPRKRTSRSAHSLGPSLCPFDLEPHALGVDHLARVLGTHHPFHTHVSGLLLTETSAIVPHRCSDSSCRLHRSRRRRRFRPLLPKRAAVASRTRRILAFGQVVQAERQADPCRAEAMTSICDSMANTFRVASRTPPRADAEWVTPSPSAASASPSCRGTGPDNWQCHRTARSCAGRQIVVVVQWHDLPSRQTGLHLYDGSRIGTCPEKLLRRVSKAT